MKLKPQVFRIDLDNPDGVFYPGNVVAGRVRLIIDFPIVTFSGISINTSGKAKVHWTETERRRHSSQGDQNNGSDVQTIDIVSTETYFKSQWTCHDPYQRNQLLPGDYSFPFNFILPASLPSSFEHDIGHVRYEVKAYLDTGYKTYKYKAFFTVINILDLNWETSARQEVVRTNSKHFGCFCCKSGPLSASVHLSKTGHVPGESIMIHADIENNSNRDLSGTSAKLIQQITFTAQNRTKRMTKIVGEVTRGPVVAGNDFCWNGVPLYVGPLPPSRLTYCTIIDIEYFVQFRVHPVGIGFDLKLDMPILVGTVPLAPLQQASSNPEFFGATAPPSHHAVPPSYEEATEGHSVLQKPNVDEAREVQGNWDFRPRYTTWNFPTE